LRIDDFRKSLVSLDEKYNNYDDKIIKDIVVEYGKWLKMPDGSEKKLKNIK